MKSWLSLVVSVALLLILLVAIRILTPMGLLCLSEWKSERAHRSSHDGIYRDMIQPTSAWVRDFLKENGRLPNEDEINLQSPVKHPNYKWITIQDSPSSGEAWGVIGSDFILCVHQDDWNLFYSSWDKKEFKYWTD